MNHVNTQIMIALLATIAFNTLPDKDTPKEFIAFFALFFYLSWFNVLAAIIALLISLVIT